ncbi:histidine kinase [Luteolibacter pohnpeiensis]|uniref:Histidine kinase n=1 Tax=Luteolibacter pohnpeiensis TaxID=454153 RepID=A0A934VUD2_9BACT|nr:histidine kinase [Luteolibacter pohnpeiensis]MBK1881015.1 histidine kinase [Luteolibacter pohnpeiensis]
MYYVVKWRGPVHIFVLIRIIDTFASIVLTTGWSGMLKRSRERNIGFIKSIGLISLLAASAVIFIHFIVRVLVIMPIAHHYQKPRLWDPGNKLALHLAAESYLFLLHTGWCAIYLLIAYLKDSRKKDQALRDSQLRLQQAELLMLRSQIRPHFLFNVMNSLLNEVSENGKAEQVIENLCVYLHHCLMYREQIWVPLDQEMQALQCFISIEQRWFSDSLHVTIVNQLQGAGVLVPGVIVRLLIEKALMLARERIPHQQVIVFRSSFRNEVLLIELGAKIEGVWGGVGVEVLAKPDLYQIRERLDQLLANQHRCTVELSHSQSALQIKIRNPPMVLIS